MKVGLSGLNVDDAAAAAPEAVGRGGARGRLPRLPAAAAEEAAPKKKRTRKKADEAGKE